MKKQITVRGVTYESYIDAAAALGLSVSAIRNAVIRGTEDRLGYKGGMPFTIRGVTYESGRAAAEALKVTPNQVYRAAAAGTLDRVGLRHRGYSLEVVVAGKHFASHREVARFLGMKVFKRNAFLDKHSIDRITKLVEAKLNATT